MAKVWCPRAESTADADLVARVAGMTYAATEPLHPQSLDMLGGLSQRILQDPGMRRVPQYVALAYWLRPAALTRLAEELARADRPGQVRTPRGVALHLPPMNVDTIFVYSWAMSVLAGNANVVRLSARLTAQQESLVTAVVEAAAACGAEDRNLYCHYEYGGETERALASHCDLRMIWGGDAKVEAVSRMPVRPDGLSIGFPDRKSLAVIATPAYQAASDDARDVLAGEFFNDVYWFDQMACGSPRLLVWLGEPGDLAADFYRRVLRVIDARGYAVETGVVLGKFGLANELLAAGASSHYRRLANTLDVSRVTDPAAAIARSHGGGFLCDWVGDLDEVSQIVTRQVQTIAYFGLSSADRLRLANSIRGRGGYRVVPIGQALQFDAIWDGIELFEHMTRKIVLR
jgi:hypothetical protein